MFHDAGRDNPFWNLHILVPLHRGVEIEILDVHCHVSGVRGGDDAIEVAFDCGEVGSGRADWARVVDEISSSGASYSSRVGFVWFVGGDYAKVCGFAA